MIATEGIVGMAYAQMATHRTAALAKQDGTAITARTTLMIACVRQKIVEMVSVWMAYTRTSVSVI